MTNPASGHRLFYALWPDADTRAALARLQAPLAGRHIPPHHLHLTMAFLGQQPAALLEPLRALAAELTVKLRTELVAAPLMLTIDRIGYFIRPRIAWAGLSEAPPALMAWQAELMRRLQLLGVAAADTHGQFKPHVTLARDAPAPVIEASDTIIWPVTQLALVESGHDGIYRVLDRVL